jgi:serine/threonine-protein kinase HipA
LRDFARGFVDRMSSAAGGSPSQRMIAPIDTMALSLAGERPFKAMNAQRWKVFAHRARLPEAAVLTAVKETVDRVNQSWWSLPERAVLPNRVLERVDAHIKLMSSILGTCPD